MFLSVIDKNKIFKWVSNESNVKNVKLNISGNKIKLSFFSGFYANHKFSKINVIYLLKNIY